MNRNLLRIGLGIFIIAAGAAGARAGDPDVVVDGEHLTVHTVTDSNFNNMVAYRYLAPAKWQGGSQVVWNLRNLHIPAKFAIKIENPANGEGFYWYQQLNCGWFLNPRSKQVEGQEGSDGVSLRPRPAAQALDFFVKHYRGKYPDLKVIGNRDLPDLPKAFCPQMPGTVKGIGEKVTYTVDGKPMEEEFYAVFHYTEDQGEAIWGLMAAHSFRAPAGTLAKRHQVFSAMAKSITPTREFSQHMVAVHQQQIGKYKAGLQASADEVAAAKRKSALLTANENQFLANTDANLAAQRNASAAANAASSGQPARTANDGQDDYIRGVETVNDPTTGTSQHSLTEQYHWTDGYSYRDSNDANYDPNKTENGNWQLMTPAQ